MKFPVHLSTLPAADASARSPRRERGIALVITLLLLAVITFMTVTFLVVSRSEQGNVATATDLTVAQNAANSGTQRAVADMMSRILAEKNPYLYGLRVSTNFINKRGFDPAAVNGATNVNYDYTINGTALTLNDRLQNLRDLLLSPRAPVYVTTNGFAVVSNEFRFYLDVNRNGRFEPNDKQPVISSDPNNPYYNVDGTLMATPRDGQTVSNTLVGDPEWIGILERPQFPHSASNQFIARYAFMVVPVGLTLDVNTMHNYTKFPNSGAMNTADGFFRNQGVLTSELNLAGFLTDLNTNLWPYGAPNPVTGFLPYNYLVDRNFSSTGAAFDDALGVLSYRYLNSPRNLAKVTSLYTPAGVTAFYNPFDVFSQGPLMTNTFWLPPTTPNPNPTYVNTDPWSGAQNPNRFTSPQDFFDVNKTAANQPAASRNLLPSLTSRLKMAATSNSTYDRFTYSRLISQLGTDSTPDPGGKLNVNFKNVDDYGRVVPGMVTNFQSWPAAQFFTNAAIRLLVDAGYTVGNPAAANTLLVTNYVGSILVTNLHIPLYPTNFYTPSVHRLLQLAANIFDSTTNKMDFSVAGAPLPLPTLFRPLFANVNAGGNIFITDYREVTTAESPLLTDYATIPKDISDGTDRGSLIATDMVYGIPVIVGAKKGLPNFNKYAAEALVQITRKLQFRRPAGATSGAISETNQMFLLGITNTFAVEGWNSYAAKLGRSMQMIILPDISVTVSNRETAKLITSVRYRPNNNAPPLPPIPAWEGSADPASFKVGFSNQVIFQATASYSKSGDKFVYPIATTFESVSPMFYVPQWDLGMKTRLRYALVDSQTKQIVDYVIIGEVNTNLDLTALLQIGSTCSSTPDPSRGSMWCTNRVGAANGVTWGMMNQIEVGLGNLPVNDDVFVKDFPTASATKEAAVNFFRAQFGFGKLAGTPGTFYTSNTFNAPYQPYRKIYLCKYWEANDPLLHYTVNDLNDLVHTNLQVDFLEPDPVAASAFTSLNERYEPWGRSRSTQVSAPINAYDIATKDPVASRQGTSLGSSDSWDFGTNKFPNPGWLGRVHRGTPWQTVYFKSPVVTDANGLPHVTSNGVPTLAWQRWTGNNIIMTNFGQLSTNLVPLYDPTVVVPPGGYPPSAYYDSFLSQPTNDWRLLDLFSTTFSDTASRGQLSVNQPGLAAWSAVMSGVIALTNTYDNGGNPVLLPMVIQPAGVYQTNSPTPLIRMVDGINAARSNRVGQVFTHMGDILSVPELSIASPFINTATRPDNSQGAYMLNDAAYERIPQQILGLLKVETSPRYAIYTWGQTLKPAAHSVYTGGGASFGLVTNYQVMAESATRTIIRIDGAPAYRNGQPTTISNLHSVIESYMVLPPD